MSKHSHTAIIFILALFVLSACSENARNKVETSKEKPVIPSSLSVYDFQPMQSNCASCHKLSPGNDGPDIAPSMAEIRATYLSAFPEKESFIHAIIAYNQSPRIDDALMRNAIAKYGLMPKLGVEEADLKTIATYLYQYEVGTEAWHNKLKDHIAVPETEEGLSYAERGRKHALGTKQALGAKLLAAIKESGPSGAVEFCNTQALPITDSMSTKFGSRIKRVSDRPRNNANRANAEEMAYIEALKAAKLQGKALDPLISHKNDSVLAYFAIETNEMCLKCHGRKDQDISIETWSVIQERYPDDLATGYGINEIRGIFVVEMEK